MVTMYGYINIFVFILFHFIRSLSVCLWLFLFRFFSRFLFTENRWIFQISNRTQFLTWEFRRNDKHMLSSCNASIKWNFHFASQLFVECENRVCSFANFDFFISHFISICIFPFFFSHSNLLFVFLLNFCSCHSVAHNFENIKYANMRQFDGVNYQIQLSATLSVFFF